MVKQLMSTVSRTWACLWVNLVPPTPDTELLTGCQLLNQLSWLRDLLRYRWMISFQ